MVKRKQWLAAILCAVILLSLFFSSACIAHEAAHHHECTGEDCPICRFIARIEQLRRGFGMALLALIAACFARVTGREWHARAAARVPALCTPVGEKIRLND